MFDTNKLSLVVINLAHIMKIVVKPPYVILMCKFNPNKLLKLSSVVINPTHIVKIVRKPPGKYDVYLNNHNIDGFMFACSVKTKQEIITACNTAKTINNN